MTPPPALQVLRVSNADLRHADLVALAQDAERAGLDAIVIGDDGETGLDPIAAAAALAPLTTGLGLIPEVDTSRQHPFGLARRLTGLDQVSAGRAGWAPRDSEPRRLVEAVEIITTLWDSWPDDAIRADKQAAVWVDVDRVRSVDLDGTFWSVHAPLDLGRSLQGQPLLLVPANWPSDAAVPVQAMTPQTITVHDTVPPTRGAGTSPPTTLRARAGLEARVPA